jgi:hypothetical protein
MLGWDWYRFHKMCVGICYIELVFFHLVGSTGHVVHFDAFETQNVDVLFSCSSESDAVFIKSVSEHVTLNLYFCIR